MRGELCACGSGQARDARGCSGACTDIREAGRREGNNGSVVEVDLCKPIKRQKDVVCPLCSYFYFTTALTIAPKSAMVPDKIKRRSKVSRLLVSIPLSSSRPTSQHQVTKDAGQRQFEHPLRSLHPRMRRGSRGSNFSTSFRPSDSPSSRRAAITSAKRAREAWIGRPSLGQSREPRIGLMARVQTLCGRTHSNWTVSGLFVRDKIID